MHVSCSLMYSQILNVNFRVCVKCGSRCSKSRTKHRVVGRRAWLVGLVGRAELNGVQVILLNFITKSGRWATQCVVSKRSSRSRSTSSRLRRCWMC